MALGTLFGQRSLDINTEKLFFKNNNSGNEQKLLCNLQGFIKEDECYPKEHWP